MIKTLSSLFFFFIFIMQLNASLVSDDERANLQSATHLLNKYSTHISLNQWSQLGSDFDEKTMAISALMDRLDAVEHTALHSSKEYQSFLSAITRFSVTLKGVAMHFMSDTESQRHYQYVMETQKNIPEEARDLPLTCLILSSIEIPPHTESEEK